MDRNSVRNYHDEAVEYANKTMAERAMNATPEGMDVRYVRNQSPVGGELSLLQEQSMMLRQQALELEQRLDIVSVRYPDAPQDNSAKNPVDTSCGLVEELRAIRKDMAVTSTLLSSILNSLQI